jgi:DNA-binding GntR family transcriptional regulator
MSRTPTAMPHRTRTPRARRARSLQELAYHRLRADIIRGVASPGSSLQEAELSRRLGMSRTPLREAIRRLSEEGLVEVLPYRGARVVRLDGRQLHELFDVREAVEGLAARLAARRAARPHLDRTRQVLRARLRQVSRAGAQYRAPALDFHQEIVKAAGNRLLADVARRLYARLWLARTVSGAFRERAAGAAREHLEILDAIARRDGDAAERLMRQHIRRSRENLLRYLEESRRVRLEP